jgi:hypothetical protein
MNIPKSPKDGDFVAHCAHVAGSTVAWYWCGDAVFHQGETSSSVSWACICTDCDDSSRGDLLRVNLSGVAVYQNRPLPTLVMPRARA